MSIRRYRPASTRLQTWDYTAPGWYFVTACVLDGRCSLGRVDGERVMLSRAGEIVADEWQVAPRIRPYVRLDEWVVMPNHLHGIVIITDAAGSRTPLAGARPRLLANSLGSIVGQFKAACTRRIHDAGMVDFAWQPRFYDHVIRSERSLDKIRAYIRQNPLRWEVEKSAAPGTFM